ncbi:MAG: hypothetical protein WC794_06970 [Candidatus Doudnabacteria bacterium]|jgi:hypothetical protein
MVKGRFCYIEKNRFCHELCCENCELYLQDQEHKAKINNYARKYVKKPWLGKKEGEILFKQLDDIKNRTTKK